MALKRKCPSRGREYGRKGSEMKNRGHYTSIRDYATGAIAAIVAMVGIEGLLQLAYIVQAVRHGWGA